MLRYQELHDAHPRTDAPVPTTSPHVEPEHHAAPQPVPASLSHAGGDMTAQGAMLAFMQSVAKTKFPPSRNNTTQSPSVLANRWLVDTKDGTQYGAAGRGLGMRMFRDFQSNHPDLLAEYDHQHGNKMIAALSPPDAHVRPDLKLAHAHLTPELQHAHAANQALAHETGQQPGYAGLRTSPGVAST